MAFYDRTIHIQAPPELVWAEVQQAAGTRPVVIEQPGRLLLVRGTFSRGIAYILDRLPDGSARLRRVEDRLSFLQSGLSAGASPPPDLTAGSSLTGPIDTLAGDRTLNRIHTAARQAASAAGWAPRPLAPGEASPAAEPAARPAPPPWHPGDLFWLAVPFSFIATGILIALNWRRLGYPRRAWIALGVTALGTVGSTVFTRYFSQNIYTHPIGLFYAYLFSLGLAYGLVMWQNLSPAYESWTALHGSPRRRQSGCLIPILVSLASVALILALGAIFTASI